MLLKFNKPVDADGDGDDDSIPDKETVDVHGTDSTGLTPLHLAAVSGHGGIISRLLTCGAKVNARCSDGSTPLHLAGALHCDC